ncbi:MAG TPA: hypothetical protein PKL81_09765 [Ferruginibacter sp.]|nr:hypothetical protein [Ferruginibacter sp.]HMX79091.1 hypothetical protein [Ferruginibacter sp.]HNA01809.1 hypothetical protein [Ferruginibacter sp.]HNA16007.1 hypothetical protein [Ferruginibacter sp.]HNF03557.1 hypothetical protein [Ferruginibacter sp.]
MKSHNPHHAISFQTVLKFMSEAFRSLFQSSQNRDFQRLKDFIAS